MKRILEGIRVLDRHRPLMNGHNSYACDLHPSPQLPTHRTILINFMHPKNTYRET